MTVIVDEDVCTGCGLCASICPDVFEMESNGKSHVKDPKGDKKYKCAKEAADSCPVQAIKIK
ncbi:MAG: ferredoxin [Thaumarchaeota archaeon]|nr:ferredoxin [Nitrososphaerota archaeon]